jgi:hypothetical protein
LFKKIQAEALKNRILNSGTFGKMAISGNAVANLPKIKRNAKVRNENNMGKTIFIPKMLMWKNKMFPFYINILY